MVRRPRRLLSTAAFAAAVAIAWTAAPACVHAAELGDVRVTSHIGQPLTADIELTTLDDPAVPVGVRIASPEIYSGAGLALPPVLSSVTLSVTRRDGRQFIHVTSLRPVDADHVHLYLDLVERGQHVVRLATVWLTPDPTPPVAAPVPSLAPAAAPLAVPVSVAAGTRARAAMADTTPAPAPRGHVLAVEPTPAPRGHAKTEPAHADAVKAVAGPSVAAAAVAVTGPVATASASAPPPVTPPGTPPVKASGGTKPIGTISVAGTHAAASRTSSAAAVNVPTTAGPAASAPAPAAAAPVAAKSLRPDLAPKLPSLHPAPKPADAAPAACTRPADDAPSCNALGSKNAELRAQLARLEDKVKILQVKLGVTPAAAPAPAVLAKPPAAPATAVLVKPPLPAHLERGALVAQAVHAAKAALPAKDATKDATKDALNDAAKEAAKPPPQTIVKPIIPPGPKPISSIKTLVPRKAAAPDDDSLPLGWIGAAVAVLALAGATATLVARRRKTRRDASPAANGLLGKLKQRFTKRAPAGEGVPAAVAPVAVPEHVEPSLE